MFKTFFSLRISAYFGCLFLAALSFSGHELSAREKPKEKLVIVGGGIIGLFEAYAAHLDAVKRGVDLRVTILEKNRSMSETTTAKIFPSLSPDEILAVVPRGKYLIKYLGIHFSEGKGIRVDDVAGLHDSPAAKQFIAAVQRYGSDDLGHALRTEALLELGKKSMELWQKLYDEGDADLRAILEESNFNPCYEPDDGNAAVLHEGYRLDVLFNDVDAMAKAQDMEQTYLGLGYKNARILQPADVMAIDPYLTDFTLRNSELNSAGTLIWKSNAAAIWRPGGCIDTGVFLPKFAAYLDKVMGSYVNADGVTKRQFRIKFGRKVTGVSYAKGPNNSHIDALFIADGDKDGKLHAPNHRYGNVQYLFSTGEDVAALEKLGFKVPSYAGFAGPSLKLLVELPVDQVDKYKNLSHCMEVHQEGVVLAWQARFIENRVLIGVGGTKAFYGDKKPKITEEFARRRHLLQLNIINGVLPDLISFALEKETQGLKLTDADLAQLVAKGIAERWVGTRAVAFDGFPTLGDVYNDEGMIDNARLTTHLGSGGASFAPAAVAVSRAARNADHSSFVAKILEFSRSKR